MGSGAKRSRTGEQTGSNSATGSHGANTTGSATAILGNLPTTLGSGEHERAILETVTLGMRDLSMEIQNLQSCVMESWEVPTDSVYITEAMKFKEEYQRACRENKGKGKDLGHMKNYILCSFFMAHKKDPNGTVEERKELDDLMGTKLRDGEGTLNVAMAPKLGCLTGHCQVTRTKKKGFITVHFREGEGQRIREIMTTHWARDGKRQWDPPMAKPIHRDIKLGPEEARNLGSKV